MSERCTACGRNLGEYCYACKVKMEETTDEARGAARELLAAVVADTAEHWNQEVAQNERQRWIERFPWLDET